MENTAFKFPYTPSLLGQGGRGRKEKKKREGEKVSFSKQGCGKAQTASPGTQTRMQRCCFFQEERKDFAVCSI